MSRPGGAVLAPGWGLACARFYDIGSDHSPLVFDIVHLGG
jgi:hypothetical protein